MNKFSKIAGAAAAATLVTISGSAFTAGSDIATGQEAVNVGSVSQSVSGVNVVKVTHDYTPTGDVTNSVQVKVAEWLDTATVVMSVKVNGATTAKDCGKATHTDVAPLGTYDAATDYSTVTCTIGETNVTSLQFIVNG